MDGGSWHCTGQRDQNQHQEEEMQKGKMAFCGRLTNSWEREKSERQRRKGKIDSFKCRVPVTVAIQIHVENVDCLNKEIDNPKPNKLNL